MFKRYGEGSVRSTKGSGKGSTNHVLPVQQVAEVHSLERRSQLILRQRGGGRDVRVYETSSILNTTAAQV